MMGGRFPARRWVTWTAATAVVALGTAFGPVGTAQAVGNNRVVDRSCGSNYIASGGSNGHYWAQTEKRSGSCDGTLSVAMMATDSYVSPRVYGTKQSAYTELWNFNAENGLHWGCNSCGSSWT